MVDEPFDPAYLENEPQKQVINIPAGDKRYYRMLHKLLRALRKLHVVYEWDGLNCIVRNWSTGEFPVERYIYVTDDNEKYGYGTSEKDLFLSDCPDEVAEKASDFLNRELCR